MIVNDFYVSLRHTKKIKIDPNSHTLPPDWGPFKEFKVADYNCPEEWSSNGYFVPAEEGMPLWIDLRSNPQCACILSVQRFNPISNEPANLEKGLTKDPKQNYMVLPNQRWIDGYTHDGKVYQFIVTKAGEGLSVNEYVLPKEMQDSHAIGLAFFLPKNPVANYIPEAGSALSRKSLTGNLVVGAWGAQQRYTQHRISGTFNCSVPVDNCLANTLKGKTAAQRFDSRGESHSDVDSIDMLNQIQHQNFDKAAMGAGGRIEQEIITDPNTPEYYQEKPALILPIYLSLPEQFNHIMKQGRRQNASKKDKYIHSGKIGGIQVPLIN